MSPTVRLSGPVPEPQWRQLLEDIRRTYKFKVSVEDERADGGNLVGVTLVLEATEPSGQVDGLSAVHMMGYVSGWCAAKGVTLPGMDGGPVRGPHWPIHGGWQ